uniref:Odorant receptor n=1 Tax=Hedya nubiferana TaxID=572853 RepID=A0A223HD20_9NEOP|nr:putative odorant receptor OR56 [Hedya nubiferana]
MWEKLRRFRPKHCDLPTTMDNLSVLLRVLALNPDGRDEGIPIAATVLTVLGIGVYVYVYVFSMVWSVFLRENEDLAGNMIMFSVGMATGMSMVKLFCVHIKSALVTKTVAAYLSCDKRVSRESRMYSNRLRYMRTIKRRATFVWLMTVTNGIAYCIRPFFQRGKHLILDAQTLYGLDPNFESPNFELTFVLVVMAVVVVVYSCATITSLLIIFVGYVEAQMLALGDEMLHLWDDAQALTTEETDPATQKKLQNQHIEHQLKSIVQTHAASLNLLHLTESVFSTSIAIEFCLLALDIISAMLGDLESTYLEIPYALNQVIIDCLIGQRLVEASLRFRETVYACKWEEFDASNMKTVLMILKNTKTMVLSAGGIAELQLTTLMYVLKSIYTTYAALRTTMNKNT